MRAVALSQAKGFAHDEDEIDSEGSWAVSYGDMVTLLCTFFIVFFSLDPKSAQNVNQRLHMSMVENLQGASNNSLYTTQQETDQKDAGQQGTNGSAAGSIDKEFLKQWNGVVHDRGDYAIVEFPGVSFFRSAQTDVSKTGQKALHDFVQTYQPFAGHYQISVRAFADHRPVKKGARKFQDNLELTALRAVSTMRILQRSGIPLNRIKVGGYGEMLTTARELDAIPKEKRSPTSELDLARKVVLVIEPEAKP